jgi:hypothetical protein
VPNPGLDRDALQSLLFRRADRLGRIKVDLRALAADAGVDYENLSTVLGSMVTEGRMRRIAGGKMSRKTYLVAPPGTRVKK